MILDQMSSWGKEAKQSSWGKGTRRPSWGSKSVSKPSTVATDGPSSSSLGSRWGPRPDVTAAPTHKTTDGSGQWGGARKSISPTYEGSHSSRPPKNAVGSHFAATSGEQVKAFPNYSNPNSGSSINEIPWPERRHGHEHENLAISTSSNSGQDDWIRHSPNPHQGNRMSLENVENPAQQQHGESETNENSKKRNNPSANTKPEEPRVSAEPPVSNRSPSSSTVGAAVPPEQFLADFRLLEDVEWGPRQDEDGYDSDQTLAPRPKTKITDEFCSCHAPPAGQQWTCRSDDCINYACREECRRNNCVEQCGNQRIGRRQFKKVEVFDAGPKGYGLRVLEDCVKGDIIQEYTGQAVRDKSLTKLFRSYQHERRLYIMALDDKVYLDAKKAGGWARFINHSCNPNCKVERWRVKGVYRAAVVALCEIKAGTELTFDYQWSRKIGRAPTKCYCGEPTCRGTLEISRTVEEVQLERLLSGNWVHPKHKRADERIVNRTIRIKKEDNNNQDESSSSPTEMQGHRPFYLVAEITEYDSESKLHKILYSDLEEKWENLNSSDFEWMLLDEELSPTRSNAIARKAPQQVPGGGPTKATLFDAGSKGGGETASGGSLLTAFSATEDQKKTEQKFYLFIQTPIKEAMFTESNSLKERVERNCQVSIALKQLARPPLPCNTDDPEDVAKFAALDQSLDGTVWKVSIAGNDKDVVKAHATLTKNVQYWQKRRQQEEQIAIMSPSGRPLAPSGAIDSTKVTDEVILPRAVVEHFKRKLPSLRERCRNVSIQMTPSESKSKLIARLTLEANLQSDLVTAQVQIRNTIISICNDLPRRDSLPTVATNTGERIPRDFGFLGGSLSKEEFESLLHNSSKALGNKGNNQKTTVGSSLDPAAMVIRSKQRDLSLAGYDLNQSPFFTTFESFYGPVWVQSEDDMGRINSKHQLVGDANSTEQRKVYFSCEPKEIASRWETIQRRARDIMRGARFIYLGTDQIFQRFLVQSHFFNYVEATTGSSISMDQVTGNHLQLDGSSKSVRDSSLPGQVQDMTPDERADLAEELLQLQIEVYRDQFTRKNSWVFGRDWTTINLMTDEPVPDSLKQIAASFGQLDIRSAPHSCVEMAEVVAHLELPGFVAAHAAIILYRFVSVVSETQIKARDAVLACVFIASKAQKCKRWKRLEAVLEAGYKAFYPGTQFDSEKEEVSKLEQRVIAAEHELLTALQYDVFVRDMDFLEEALTQKGKFLDTVFGFAFCGQVLGAGAKLWLKYGIDYIFAAAAAVLKADLGKVVTTLGLIPLKVGQTLKLITENARYGRPASDKVPSNPLLEGNRERLDKHISRIEQVCVELTSRFATNPMMQLETKSPFRLRCLEIARENRCVYIIKGVSHHLVAEKILQHLDGIEAESGCSISLCPTSTAGVDDIRIQGPWRAVAIAFYLLRSSKELSILPDAIDEFEKQDSSTQLQVKTNAGLIDAREICTSGGWEGTLQPLGRKDHTEKQFGGKSCLAGKVPAPVLRVSGLRWWVRQTKGLSQTGSFTEMFSIRYCPDSKIVELSNLARYMDDEDRFPILSSLNNRKNNESNEEGPDIAVSLQRWPSEKISCKEKKRSKKLRKEPMSIGFSPGALQEMQLLTKLHKVVPSPHGHPNFILPVAIAIPGGDEQIETPPTAPEGDDPMFSLFKTTQENETAAMKEKKVKSSPHLVFQPCPFILHRFISRKNDDVDVLEAPIVLSSWFNDLLSAMVHCHSNHVLLRNLQSDQVIIDHSGAIKLSGLYRATVVEPEDRRHTISMANILKGLKRKGFLKKKEDEDDVSSNPFVPPEILLGSPKFNKSADVWVMGCLLANILLSKPSFVGKDRQSLLTSIYKIVGIPAQDNFEDAARFPYYVQPSKRYKRGVEKAMEHMLKSEYATKYSKAIDLIAKMLHLDPDKRCTAEEALNHDFLKTYRDQIKGKLFRESYVEEWLALKGKILNCSKHSNGTRRVESERRRALMLATATGADSNDENEDGLYDFGL